MKWNESMKVWLCVFFSFFFDRKTFSSFICSTEILKSFQFFCDTLPSFFWGCVFNQLGAGKELFRATWNAACLWKHFTFAVLRETLQDMMFSAKKWTAKFMKISARISTKWQSSHFWSIAGMNGIPSLIAVKIACKTARKAF